MTALLRPAAVAQADDAGVFHTEHGTQRATRTPALTRSTRRELRGKLLYLSSTTRHVGLLPGQALGQIREATRFLLHDVKTTINSGIYSQEFC